VYYYDVWSKIKVIFLYSNVNLELGNKRVKRLVSDLVKKAGPSLLITNLANNTPSLKLEENTAPAIAWVALIIKEHSGIDEAVSLYRTSLELQPKNTSVILNLIHTLELKLDYESCFKHAKEFCTSYTTEEMHPQFFSSQEFDEVSSCLKFV
jgi:hypothetical protein